MQGQEQNFLPISIYFFEGTMIIKGNIDGKRVTSKNLEEKIQKAIKDGAKELTIVADGQHGIGGRIWPQYGRVSVTIEGTSGQRVGSMGMEGTEIPGKGFVLGRRWLAELRRNHNSPGRRGERGA